MKYLLGAVKIKFQGNLYSNYHIYVLQLSMYLRGKFLATA